MPQLPRCVKCQEGFPTEAALRVHAQFTGHRVSFVCLACTAEFDASSELDEHKESTGHQDPDAGEATLASVPASNGFSRVSDPLTCPMCIEHFDSKDELVNVRLSFLFASVTPIPIFPLKNVVSMLCLQHIASAAVCKSCMVCLHPGESIEDHYWDSKAHPKCKPCALGFENLAVWNEHKTTCPISPHRQPSDQRGRDRKKRQNRQVSQAAAPDITTTETSATPDFSNIASSGAGAFESRSTTTAGPNAPAPAPQPITTRQIVEDAFAGRAAEVASSAAELQSIGIAGRVARQTLVSPNRHISSASSIDDCYESAVDAFEDRNSVLSYIAPPLAANASPYEGEWPVGEKRSEWEEEYPLDVVGDRFVADEELDGGPSREMLTVAPDSTKASSVSVGEKTFAWRCRLCLREPCDPITAICGHIFCHGCFVEVIRTKLCCPVCERRFLIRIHADFDS